MKLGKNAKDARSMLSDDYEEEVMKKSSVLE
jgi:hypothetical protein